MNKIRIIVLVSIAFLMIALIIAYCHYFNSENLASGDKQSIIKTVKNYYSALENQDFDQALSYCELDDQDNDLHMTTQTRVTCLKELRHYIISGFKFTQLVNSNNSVGIYNDKEDGTYNVEALYQLSYVNTVGGLLNELIQLKKISGLWKIVKLQSSDRYACYRVGSYQYVFDARILIPNKQ